MSFERPNEIWQFDGQYGFLSNFYATPIEFEGYTYPSVEHAYQAAKTRDPIERLQIRNAITPGIAKRLGRALKLRPDWEDVKVDTMLQLIRIKFSDPKLRSRLLQTENAKLIEGNTWNDTFWGWYQGKGQNMLGKLLMQVRDELR